MTESEPDLRTTSLHQAHAAKAGTLHRGASAFGDVAAVPVFTEVQSRVSQYRLIPYQNKQVPHCHFPSCTASPRRHPVSEISRPLIPLRTKEAQEEARPSPHGPAKK